MTFLAVEHMWGSVWSVEELDFPGLVARIVVSVILAFVTVALVVLIITPFWLYSRLSGHMAASAAAADLPRADTLTAAATSRPAACPNCGNTKSLDISPCVACGANF